MTARLLDGKALSNQIIDDLRAEVGARRDQGLSVPGLAVVLVGEDPASAVYVRNKRKACARAGIHSRSIDLPEPATESQILDLVDQLNADPDIHGILVQLPLPGGMEASLVTNRIAPHKDVDGFHATNVGRLALRQPGLRPCTPKGVMRLLDTTGMDYHGQHAVVVGASNIVGRPMVLELLLAGCTVTCCHRFTRDLREHVAAADILVVAVGIPGLVPGEWVQPGSVVVDVGMNRLADGRLCGDVEAEGAMARAGWITPVPGGVGPMTVASLLENTLEAARLGDPA